MPRQMKRDAGGPAKCPGTGCDKRGQCYRFRDMVRAGQEVLDPVPVKRITQACAYYHPVGSAPSGLLMTIAEAEAWAASHTEARKP